MSDQKLREALLRLSNAAFARDSTMGDQIRLIEVRVELAAANKQAMEALAAPAGEQVGLTDAEIEDHWWGELDNRSLSAIRRVIAAHEAKRVSCSQTAKKTTHEAGRVDETGKNEHVGGAA